MHCVLFGVTRFLLCIVLCHAFSCLMYRVLFCVTRFLFSVLFNVVLCV